MDRPQLVGRTTEFRATCAWISLTQESGRTEHWTLAGTSRQGDDLEFPPPVPAGPPGRWGSPCSSGLWSCAFPARTCRAASRSSRTWGDTDRRGRGEAEGPRSIFWVWLSATLGLATAGGASDRAQYGVSVARPWRSFGMSLHPILVSQGPDWTWGTHSDLPGPHCSPSPPKGGDERAYILLSLERLKAYLLSTAVTGHDPGLGRATLCRLLI